MYSNRALRSPFTPFIPLDPYLTLWSFEYERDAVGIALDDWRRRRSRRRFAAAESPWTPQHKRKSIVARVAQKRKRPADRAGFFSFTEREGFEPSIGV